MTQIRILVPLDGSLDAERALEEAVTLAKALRAEVVLLQVVPPFEGVSRERARTLAIDEVWERERDGAIDYLNAVRTRPEWRDVVTEAAVEMGDPAETILGFCETHGIDRIVMASHGRTGLKRWVYRGATKSQAFQAIEEKIRANVEAVLSDAAATRVQPRQAALRLASARVEEAMRYRRFNVM